MISTRNMPVPLRAAILIVAISAMLGVALASGSVAHFHKNSTGGQCDVCMTAHLTSLEARAVFHRFGSVEMHEILAPGIAMAGYQVLLDYASPSRGPPPVFL